MELDGGRRAVAETEAAEVFGSAMADQQAKNKEQEKEKDQEKADQSWQDWGRERSKFQRKGDAQGGKGGWSSWGQI